jgi:diacylglycerol kinase family enzyme
MIAAPRRTSHRARGFGSRLEHDLTEFTLRADRPLPFQVDGDALEERSSVRFRGVANALDVYV